MPSNLWETSLLAPQKDVKVADGAQTQPTSQEATLRTGAACCQGSGE